jgi:predicted PurR-regulated permease PerM
VHSRPGKDMAFPDRRTLNILLTILLFATVCALVYSARRILVIFFFAILFTYLLDPVVKGLQRHSPFFKNLRGPAVVEVYLAFLVFSALVAHEVAPGFLWKTGQLFDEIPALLDAVSTGEIATQIGDQYGWSETQELRLKAFLAWHREDIQSFVRSGKQFTSSAAQAIAFLVVVPLLAIFFLRDGGHIANVLIRLASAGGKYEAVQAVADEINLTLRSYIRAKVILGGLSFLFYSMAMLLLNFPHAIALGLVGGVLEFIPVAGWMISAAAIISVGVLTQSHWMWMAVLLGIWRVVQDYYASPRVLGHQLEIHPLLAIFAVMVGWEIGGLVGIYLLVPVFAAIRGIWHRYGPPSSEPQKRTGEVHATTHE